MKKIFGLLSVLSVLIFAGCYDNVFYNINQDVAPEKATVSGPVNSIARYSSDDGIEYLICAADEGLRYKMASNREHGAWRTYGNLPFSLHHYDYYNECHQGQEIIKVLADSNTLYLVTVEYTRDTEVGTTIPSRFNIWAKQMISLSGTLYEGGDWTNLTSGSFENLLTSYASNDYYYTSFNVFGTNAVQKSHRKVFIRCGVNVYYELSGLTIKTASVSDSLDGNSINGINSAAYYGEDLRFFASKAVTTNETLTSPSTIVYWGSGNTLYYFNGTVQAPLNAGEVISCLAVCGDALLIGRGDISAYSSSTNGGLVKTTLTNGIPGNALTDFTTNAESQLSSAYIILCLLNVNPEESEKNSALYASISFKGSGSSSSVAYENVGLWSYYPGRGNWNRE